MSDPWRNELELFDRVLNVLEECGTYERHFNQIQSFYRGLASSWLLAALGGMGFVLTKERLTIDPHLLIGCIGITGAIGLFLLWVLDILVYHRLLLSVYNEAQALEGSYQWKPSGLGSQGNISLPLRIRKLRKEGTKNVGFMRGPFVTKTVTIFYCAAQAVLLGASLCAFWRLGSYVGVPVTLLLTIAAITVPFKLIQLTGDNTY